MTQDLSIGALARETATPVPTIRYFEKIGLLPEPARTHGGQRRYGWAHLERLRFIRHGRALGFSQDDVRDLLRLADAPEAPCDEADAIARENLATVRTRIAQLRALEGELERMIGQCTHGSIRDCRIMEVLADHDECGGDHDA